jgi:hypothetical protein
MASRWVTRERPTVQRIACPWFIRRFIDPEAEIVYVPKDDVLAVAESEGATPFDPGGIRPPEIEFANHGDGKHSFDAFVSRYRPDDAACRALADILRRGEEEWTGVLAIAKGFRQMYDEQGQDDHKQLAAMMPIYEAIYRFCQRKVEKT